MMDDKAIENPTPRRDPSATTDSRSWQDEPYNPDDYVQYGLVRAFTDFHLLPDLLACAVQVNCEPSATLRDWTHYLSVHVQNVRHMDPNDVPTGAARYRFLAQDVWHLANRLHLLTPNGISAAAQPLAAIATTPMAERTEGQNQTVTRILGKLITDHYLGEDGIPIVPLLQKGAQVLSETTHLWAIHCPGLLLIEMDALIYHACVNAEYAQQLADQLISWRDTPMHPVGFPNPYQPLEPNSRTHYEHVTDFYTEHTWLAERSDMTFTEQYATAMLLITSGLLVDLRLADGDVICLLPNGIGDLVPKIV